MKTVLVLTHYDISSPSGGFCSALGSHIKLLEESFSVLIAAPTSGDSLSCCTHRIWMKLPRAYCNSRTASFLACFLCTFLLLRLLRERRKVDILLLESPYLILSALMLSKILRVPLWLRSHNIEFVKLRRLKKWTWRIAYALEVLALRTVEQALFITRPEQRYAVRFLGFPEAKAHYLPYQVEFQAADLGRDKAARNLLIETDRVPSDAFVLSFFGYLDYPPNRQAVLFILHEIVPHLSIELEESFVIVIAGRCSDEVFLSDICLQQGVRYLGYYDDLETLVRASDLVLNPVAVGAGLSTRVLDTLKFNTPVISSRVGARGIPRHLSCSNLIVPARFTGECFAREMVGVLGSPKRQTSRYIRAEFGLGARHPLSE